MHLALQHCPSYSVIAAEGHLTESTIESVLDVFSLIPCEQSLVVDLAQVIELDASAARALGNEIATRAAVAHVALVFVDAKIGAALVRAGLHDVVPFVDRFEHAVSLVASDVMAGR